MAAYYNEFDPRAAAWLRELIRRGLIADGEVDERSILDVPADDLRGYTQCHFFAGIGGWSHALRLAGWPDDRPVWTGSPPCQPFSSAGQQKGKDDDRHLAPHFASLVAAERPTILFGEQVASAAVFGKAAKRAASELDGEPEWAWIDDLFGRLEAARYACGAVDLPAAGIGAPHIRQRTFFGAVRLADAECSERGPISVLRLRQADGAQGGGAAAEPARDRDCGGLADASSERRERGQGAEAGRKHDGQDAEWQQDHDGPVGSNEAGDGSQRTRTPHGGWADADWLFCRDGKWRPVEPATLPLAHGVSARVVRLRGYGNAIVPQVAAQFVRAFDQALRD